MYISTRGSATNVSAAQAIKAGIAEDGGLYVPTEIPRMDLAGIQALVPLSYAERAAKILRLFLSDFTEEEILSCVESAYGETKFDTKKVAPIVSLSNGIEILELWHGPTCAFKDMALQLLPHLLKLSLNKTGEKDKIVILVATSGDTGKAALEGFKDVDGTEIMVFFPHDGVSNMQKLQMVTQEGKNVHVIAVNGNFDDAQTGVKNIFNDVVMKKVLSEYNCKLSSANSINWGRLVPQIVYYFSAYADLLAAGRISLGQSVNFAVPTGNFGNILAGFYALNIELPIQKLLCASNTNMVLHDFLATGVYDKNRDFFKTISPSMDILISSNLERLLYHLSEGDTKSIQSWMQDLNQAGRYQIPYELVAKLQEHFWGAWADDQMTLQAIGNAYREEKYLLDPHTAVAWQVVKWYREETKDTTPCIIVSTASPFKFAAPVLAGLGLQQKKHSDFALLQQLSETTGWKIPEPLKGLEGKEILHHNLCGSPIMMPAFVKNILGIE